MGAGRRIRVRGQVQGVGFRPFVWQLARERGLTGVVLNDPEGVLILAAGADLDGFERALVERAPLLARVDAVESLPCEVEAEGFVIGASEGAGAETRVTPDAASLTLHRGSVFGPLHWCWWPPQGDACHSGARGNPSGERTTPFETQRRRSAVTKRTTAKYKIDRRMGENIWGRPKSPVNRREYGPGQHGQRRKGKVSDFGLQLRAKQKLKGYYGDLTEKQFRRIYGEAERQRGDTGELLIGLLERRLDAVVYRAKFVPTVFAARQFVNHGHVLVNGQRVNIPSYRVKEGDVIEVREKSKQLASVIEATQLPERDVPDYIEADHSKMTATFVRTPALGDVPYPVMMEPNLVIEFYAQN